MNWIDEVLEGTDHVETPKQFVRWSLFSAISAVASPLVHLNKQGAYELYPNLYVFLYSESGIGKGFGVWLAKSLVSIVNNTRVFAGRNSIQKIVTDLSLAYTREKKEMIKDARAFLASGEFVNFLLKDDQAISILTEWYDTHYVKDWTNSLKSSGAEKLTGVNVTLLGASSPDYLRDAVPVAAIRGGFFARIMFVYAGEKGKLNALIDEPEEHQNVAPRLQEWAKPLIELSKIPVGSEFRVDNGAREHYRPWYYDLQSRIREGLIVDKTGYIHRLHDHALKVAMVLSLAESPELVIQKRHIEEGISLCVDLLATVKKTTLGIGLSVSAPKNEAFLRTLFKAPDFSMTRMKMLQLNSSEFDAFDLDKIALTFEDAGFVKTSKTGPNLTYHLTPVGRKQFIDIQEEVRRKRDKKSGS